MTHYDYLTSTVVVVRALQINNNEIISIANVNVHV